ncbi:Uncharacterised protein [Vibrio cholerae]|uniref:Uncharacterized protein n=1 Tax=Vibrio cholerae TaxID=666 RepID=A0A655YEA1_VIBCL|nr:Uncharacterised protein [Vibrio cholerae]
MTLFTEAEIITNHQKLNTQTGHQQVTNKRVGIQLGKMMVEINAQQAINPEFAQLHKLIAQAC